MEQTLGSTGLRHNFLVLFAAVPLLASAQTVSYDWPNTEGLSVIYPHNSEAALMGTVSEWVRIETCTVADRGRSTLLCDGWPVLPGPSCLRFYVLAFEPLALDSIVVTHRRAADGPDRFQMIISCGSLCGERVVLDTIIPDRTQETAFALHGWMEPVPGQAYDWVYVKLVPYGGHGGAWEPRALRLVASQPGGSPEDVDLVQGVVAQFPNREPVEGR